MCVATLQAAVPAGHHAAQRATASCKKVACGPRGPPACTFTHGPCSASPRSASLRVPTALWVVPTRTRCAACNCPVTRRSAPPARAPRVYCGCARPAHLAVSSRTWHLCGASHPSCPRADALLNPPPLGHQEGQLHRSPRTMYRCVRSNSVERHLDKLRSAASPQAESCTSTRVAPRPIWRHDRHGKQGAGGPGGRGVVSDKQLPAPLRIISRIIIRMRGVRHGANRQCRRKTRPRFAKAMRQQAPRGQQNRR